MNYNDYKNELGEKNSNPDNIIGLNDKFVFKKSFTDAEKIHKFNGMCEEYNRLMNYRKMLYVIVTKNYISSEFNEEGLIINKIRNLSADEINNINNEINTLNSVISWIEIFILDNPQLTKKIQEYEKLGTNTEEN